MMTFVLPHLLESTFFCLLVSVLAYSLRSRATVRYTVWFVGIAKFAIPTVLLAKTGAEIAFFLPAASWLSLTAAKVSALFAALLNAFPANREIELVAAWAFGTIAMTAIWMRQLLKSKVALLMPSEQEQEVFQRLRASLNLPVPARLRCTDDSIEPALRGVWRSTVTIPSGLSQKLTRSEFDSVLLHELSHARRLDNLASVFVHALVCLFWFHPLLWIVERRLTIERERACDEAVIARGMTPQFYAAAILKVCEFHLFETAPGLSGIAGSDLKRRLELILDTPPRPGLLYVPWLLLAGLAIFMTLVPIAGGYCEQCGSTGQSATEFDRVK